ncbi:Uncharacterised protein [Sphingobacterium spiritivorum]|uniref:Uncharacterized protein n=1 Tax=Sphingobacterium spiritivorum TaxID=258 RepID=A0A380CGJ8_SPHSI|nr:hypothetical protein [Sphingobacterium spiritivorum]SUJ18977.1 Uncharacterised protein [Sphingobacterium spiritivorum]
MKQKQITTGKATIVVVDAPHGNIPHSNLLDFPDGSWSHLGPLSQVTEDQWKEIVDQVITSYQDYTDNTVVPTFSLFSSTESGLSLLRANGVLLENPLGVWNGPDGRPQTFPDGAQFNSAIELYNFQKKWDKAQSEVWKNPYIFIKVNYLNKSGNP